MVIRAGTNTQTLYAQVFIHSPHHGRGVGGSGGRLTASATDTDVRLLSIGQQITAIAAGRFDTPSLPPLPLFLPPSLLSLSLFLHLTLPSVPPHLPKLTPAPPSLSPSPLST